MTAPPPLRESLGRVGEKLRGDSEELNDLDGIAGDGDLGLTAIACADAMDAVIARSDPDLSDVDLLRAIGIAMARAAASTGGTLIATGFMRASSALLFDDDPAPVRRLAIALSAATAGIQERGKASEGEKTLLDVLLPVSRYLATADTQSSVADALHEAAEIAAAAVESGKDLVPKRGRAGWLAERAMGHPDAGSRLIQRVLEHAAEVVRGD